MTSISTRSGLARVQRRAKGQARNLALDRARTFLTLVVLLHHAVIPYTYFGHTDPKSFVRFRHDRARHRQFLHGDVLFPVGIVRLVRHRPQGTARTILPDRLLRLGLPFVICAFTVIPLAYYAISLRHHPEIGFSEFWWKTITKGPWPSGPIWFLWVLLAFDLVGQPAVPAVADAARSDQSPVAARSSTSRPVFFAVSCWRSPRRSTFPALV